ncbi:hypothetical protein B0A79_19180 [Flavobacterium piscis]|uniref:Uncharacterized protein n=1 Tax=Flavobacterium piscis TaxID=1114874 RepID=A0ABX2XJY9_9FLAO|nr:hypothetical protein FLP_09195 [Flavobacterium piscis]OXE99690.1 hypothetical protein B0A79_19180 [Flavobacterium piscis]
MNFQLRPIKNSGNQPEFQSSIKKRTVNQTVVCFKVQYKHFRNKFQIPTIIGIWNSKILELIFYINLSKF